MFEIICLHIIQFEIFIHTSVKLSEYIFHNNYVAIGKYILVIFHSLFVIRNFGVHAHLSKC